MKTIIYDFNGTVLDDVDVGVIAINAMIDRYLKRDHLSKDEYRKVFGFPVIEYYRKVGFDFDELDFKVVGQEWMDVYEANKDKYALYPHIHEQLQSNIEGGARNILLSASRSDKLKKQCEELGIKDLFDEILGIEDIYAGSKVHIAKEWMKKQDDTDGMVFIGDTLHDLEVANELYIPCILVAAGHQDKAILCEYTDHVYDDLKEAEKDAYWPI